MLSHNVIMQNVKSTIAMEISPILEHFSITSMWSHTLRTNVDVSYTVTVLECGGPEVTILTRDHNSDKSNPILPSISRLANIKRDSLKKFDTLGNNMNFLSKISLFGSLAFEKVMLCTYRPTDVPYGST